MKFLVYIYWRLLLVDKHLGSSTINRWTVYFQIAGIVGLYLMAIAATIDSFTGSNLINVDGWLDDDKIANRLVKIPLLLSPIVFALAFFFSSKRDLVLETISFFESLDKPERMYWSKMGQIFIFITAIFVVAGFTSSTWSRYIR